MRENFSISNLVKKWKKKLKTYKKDLDNKFKNKIRELEANTLNQSKYNSLISELISKMSLDDVIEEDEKKEEDNRNEQHKDQKNEEQKSDEQKDENQEMSIESGVPDLEQQTKDSDQEGEEIEIEDSSELDIRKKKKIIWAT